MRTGQPNTRTSFGAQTPFSCTFRLDPHAAFPDTRARSLNKQSVSKNVPDRNPYGSRSHANTRLVGKREYIIQRHRAVFIPVDISPFSIQAEGIALRERAGC